jgi:hypothetical protein
MGVRQGCYRSGIGIIFFFSFLTSAWSATTVEPSILSAKIGKKELVRMSEVTIIKDDLTKEREIFIAGKALGGLVPVVKVEVSLDNGQTWKEAIGHEQWQYRFSPLPNYFYYLTFRVTNVDGIVSDPKRFGVTRLTYLPLTLSELIQRQADELARTYMSEDLERYMALISRDYQNLPPGWFNLRRAIENDFRSLNNITLRFTVNQVYETDTAIIANVFWRLTYGGLLEPKEGTVEIHFDPSDKLKIILQRRDLYFGATPTGHDGKIQITGAVPIPGIRRYTFVVTDLDKVGATFISIRVRIVYIPGGVQFDGMVTLTETPFRSGRFEAQRDALIPGGSMSCTATYIDEITSDWRRNVRRTATF